MCDCLVALAPASASGVTLFAKNSDRPPHEDQVIERHEPRAEPVTHATHVTIDPAPRGGTIGFVGSRPYWAWGIEHGVNDAGVAVGNETIYTTLDPRGAEPGLIGIDLVRLALERAATADEAVDVVTTLVARHGQGGSGHAGADRPYWSSFLIADPRAAFVVETSGREFAVEAVVRTRAISNRTTIPAFDAAHRHPRQPVETLVDPRWTASRSVLATEPVSVSDLVAHARSHAGGGDGWTVCMHVDGVEVTTAALVAELPVGEPPRARFLLGSPCTSVFVPLLVGPPLGAPLAWDRFAALTDADRPRLDRLGADLEARFSTALEDTRERDLAASWNAQVWQAVGAAL
jgi:hypothetical protein